jgi:predicted ATPase with chaperone activity
MAIEAKKQGIKALILPRENALEAAIITGLDIMEWTHYVKPFVFSMDDPNLL